jgi:predicted AlkP superfamily phosphohydrolase/phosphomutase
MTNRLLIIGWDGATFDLIRPWVADGRLPNLARLMETGCSGPLRSTLQPTTAAAWTTFLTGVNQGKHGLYDFVTRRQESYDLEITSGRHIKAPSLFDLLGQQNRKTVGVNIPYTAPVRPVNGVLIGGPFAPTVTPDLFFPRSYHEKILQLIPNYFVLPDYDARAADPLADYAQKLMVGIANREKIGLELLEREAWDLFMLVFMETDEVQHTFWRCLTASPDEPEFAYRDTIRQVYERLDEALGRLIAQATAVSPDPLTILVVSDHGAGHFDWMINLNQWLAESGFLQFRQGGATPLRQIKSSMLQRMALAYRRYLPADWRAAARNWLGTERFEQVKGEFETSLMAANIHWEKTQAYALGAGGNIYINLAGREPQGVIQPGAAYERLRQDLAAQLMTMRNPDTGKPMIKQAHMREALYAGPYLEQAPDLVIEWADYAYWGRGQYDSQSAVFQKQRHFDFSDQPLTGSHRLEGILVANGPGIRPGAEISAAKLLDMAPTALGLLGMQPSAEMDGRLLTDLFDAAYLNELQQSLAANAPLDPLNPADHQYTAEEEALITEHLRSLGYL